MRAFSLVKIVLLFCCLSSTLAWAQELECKPCWNDFGKVQIGTSGSSSIELSNIGHKTLSITSTSKQGTDFSFGKFRLPLEIEPGANVQLPVIFTPKAKGFARGILTMVSNAPGPSSNIHVAGIGIDPTGAELAVIPASLDFGSVTVGSSASLPITLTASNDSITISRDRSTSSEFALLGLDLPVTIPAGQGIPLTIQFTPSGSGKDLAKVGFISNATNSPTVIPVTGTGVVQDPQNVELSWNADGTAVGYNVYRSNAKAGPFEQINNALDASTNYTDDTVVAGATYYYATNAVNAQGDQSGYSNIVEAVVPDR